MTRKPTPRPPREPNPGALEAVNQALTTGWGEVAAEQIDRRETKVILRQRVAAYSATAARWQRQSQELANANQKLDEENYKLKQEVSAWKTRFDRLLEAVATRGLS